MMTEVVDTQMAPPREPRLISPVALERILGYLDRGYNPAYLGFISLEIGYSLRQTEEMVDLLVDRGQLRRLSVGEVRALGFDERSVIYARVK